MSSLWKNPKVLYMFCNIRLLFLETLRLISLNDYVCCLEGTLTQTRLGIGRVAFP